MKNLVWNIETMNLKDFYSMCRQNLRKKIENHNGHSYEIIYVSSFLNKNYKKNATEEVNEIDYNGFIFKLKYYVTLNNVQHISYIVSVTNEGKLNIVGTLNNVENLNQPNSEPKPESAPKLISQHYKSLFVGIICGVSVIGLLPYCININLFQLYKGTVNHKIILLIVFVLTAIFVGSFVPIAKAVAEETRKNNLRPTHKQSETF